MAIVTIHEYLKIFLFLRLQTDLSLGAPHHRGYSFSYKWYMTPQMEDHTIASSLLIQANKENCRLQCPERIQTSKFGVCAV
jgi:hypothetical protein